jgi:hypothetical protein
MSDSAKLAGLRVLKFAGQRTAEPAIYLVISVGQLKTPLRKLSDCGTASWLRIYIVRNEEAGGSNPLSSTKTIHKNAFSSVAEIICAP